MTDGSAPKPYTEEDVTHCAHMLRARAGWPMALGVAATCAQIVLDALAEAGRLLPEDAEVETIYGARNSRSGDVQAAGPGPVGIANARASLHPIFDEVVVQERRRWPDGARMTSAWRRYDGGSDG